jgi:hypothetical protein
MRSFLCLIVPLLLSGCPDSHGLLGDAGRDAGGPSDYLCECCPGVSVLAGSASACSVACLGLCGAADAGSLPGTCGLREVELVCFDHVRVGTPTSVEVTYAPDGDCFCAQEITCDARIVEPGRLALTTALCPERPVCRACEGPPTGTCALPPLPTPGRWLVEVNGRATMELDVVPPDVLPERADVCVLGAPAGGCGDYTPEGFTVGRACHDSWAAPGTRVPIRVTEQCGTCTSVGPCEVTVVDGSVFVSPTQMQGVCGLVCPDICMLNERTCWTPPLAPGLYTVVIDGLPSGETTAIEVSDGGTSVETCAGG